jgi:23S rRNA (adenine2030-N6)-methyltransferase
LLHLLDEVTADPAPLTIVDTHAGAGLYDLTDPAQARSKEAEAGIKRLLDKAALPEALRPLAEAVRRRNGAERVDVYPGSPALVLERLRSGDRLVACELNPEIHAALATLFAPSAKAAEARLADGFSAAVEIATSQLGRLLVLIDPPFERADDYARIAETIGGVRRAKPDAVALVWLPLKDLETLDAFVRRLEALKPASAALICETRVRPLTDPMRMNGCALVAIGAPSAFACELEAVSRAVVDTLGEQGASARLWRAGR